MEIFESRWEYFKVLCWCLVPPTVDQLIKEPVSFQELENKYKAEVDKIVTSRKKERDALLEIIDRGVSSEEERRTGIDVKAGSMISQTGLAVTLIVAAFSLISVGVSELVPKIVILVLLCFASVNLIAAGLHARHVVSLNYPYPRHDFAGYLGTTQPSTDYILSQLFIIQRLSQINDVKGTFLRFSHWFYKATFVVLFMITLIGPVFLFSTSLATRNSPSVVNIGTGNSQGTINRESFPSVRDSARVAQARSKVDSLKEKRNMKTAKAK